MVRRRYRVKRRRRQSACTAFIAEFWAKDAVVYEQPEVSFQSKLVLFASVSLLHAKVNAG